MRQPREPIAPRIGAPAALRQAMRVLLALASLVATAACSTYEHGTAPDATAATGPQGDAAAAQQPVTPDGAASLVAWYQDGLTTGTASANDFSALGVTADTIEVAQLATLIETNKYNALPRATTSPVDFDEVFLTRAEDADFMAKLALAAAQVRAAQYARVIVYCNGPKSMAMAATLGWAAIARAGAMVGLESYTTTFWPDIKAAYTANGFVDATDVPTLIAHNPDLYAAFQTTLTGYVESTKAQLADPTLADHITLLEFEGAAHDLPSIETLGYSPAAAADFAALWYAALEAVAHAQAVHFGTFHPA
jgi:hypothetical protein